MKLSTVLLSLATLASASPFASRSLQKRGLEKCKTLQADANHGGRKVAIVIDESGSMTTSDPGRLRVEAGKAINDWLISSKEAGNGKSADLVSVIGFDDTSRLLYGLGDPSGADKAFDQVAELGGTFIAGGVDEAVQQLTSPGHDPTSNRSAIIVLTDGEDSDTISLVDSIDKAGQLGIRVSFGFLQSDGLFSYQDPEVLTAILGTGGFYATVDGSTAQNAFVNVMIVHGLTDNDNSSPQNATTVFNGLSIAFVIDSSGSNTLTYTAQSGEKLTFSFTSVSAGNLNVTAMGANGQQLNRTTVNNLYSYSPTDLVVTAPSDGVLNLKVEGNTNQENAVFIVGVNSSIPLTNCTLGSTNGGGLSSGAKAGIGISVPLIIGLLGAGGYFMFKYWKGMPQKPGSAPAQINQPPAMDYKQPYVQTTDLPTPSPQPISGPPVWSLPPKFHAPGKSNNPNEPHTDSDKPDHNTYNQPDSHQQPFQQPQADPSQPSHADPNPYNGLQVDHSPGHAPQIDHNPSNVPQVDHNPYNHSPQTDPNPNSHAPQLDPNQPPASNPTNPQSPHSHRLPMPRFPLRLFGRRRKKDDDDQNQTQNSSSEYASAGTVSYPQSPQVVLQQEPQQIQHVPSPATSPQYVQPGSAIPYEGVQQYPQS